MDRGEAGGVADLLLRQAEREGVWRCSCRSRAGALRTSISNAATRALALVRPSAASRSVSATRSIWAINEDQRRSRG
jgi:hypothetical protein